MKTACFPSFNRLDRERGGITILLALILLSVMTVAAFGLSRNTLREIAITGNESIGRKAFESADSGVDWTITWLDRDAVAVTAPQIALRNAREAVIKARDPNEGAPDPLAIGPDGSNRYILYGKDYTSALTPSLANLKQVSELKPSFDTEIRYLREVPPANMKSQAVADLWLVRSVGQVQVGTTNQRFFSRREAIIEVGRY